MIIKIRHKRRMWDENGTELAGECAMPTRSKQIITVSRSANPTVNKYAGTLLHEFLHSWVNILERKGFNTIETTEENFILEAERIVIRTFKKHFLKRRK